MSAAPKHADQRAHDVFWMTAKERNEYDKCAVCRRDKHLLHQHPHDPLYRTGTTLCLKCNTEH